MKKNAVLLFLTVMLTLTVEMQLNNLATANFVVYLPYITIKGDGSVEPETEYISQTGNVYTLTANLTRKYAIKVQCSNITFDGKGHCINGTVSSGGLGYGNNGLSLVGVTNVTVNNLEVTGFMNNDVSLDNCSKCTIHRVQASKVFLEKSNFNNITENNIGNANLGYVMICLSNNNI